MKGLYVHIPFCLKKCRYCDFNSAVMPDSIQEEYVNAIICEMAEYRKTEVDTVYIGGGTPTVLKTDLLKSVIDGIKNNFILLPNTEFTVEMNPKTADSKKLKMLFNTGVNRLSIGVQSFCDEELKELGRVHSGNDAKDAIKLAKEAGFENISIDLMSAIPKQTLKSFAKTLETAILQNPDHISCYSLILEEGTPLFDDVKSGRTVLCDEETERDIYEYAVKTLEANGYRQYEISNFAKDGKASRHNMKYWTMQEYVGVGLSAHSFLENVRFSNTDDFKNYISHNFRSGNKEVLTKSDMMSEFAFLGLRMTEGISETVFSEKFREDIFEVFKKPLEKFIKTGFLVHKNGRIFLSKEGISVSNQIMCEFLL
ncbi:MAG: oxygen-independent coproporphyrinogen III oxidase [Clostridia bacterium]|nr:oxygen-independent coproporphyrinogen III oxidase [Clostridia bacterium]